MSRSDLTRYAWVSVAAALVTMGIKAAAYRLTGSVGILSDALESGVNLVGAIMATAMLAIAARPADEDHPFGHQKAEYFASGVEAALIVVAAIGIAAAAVERLLHPRPLERVGVGLVLTLASGALNFAVSVVLRRAGERYESIALRADARHLMTDVWTSIGVVVGVGAVAVTGWRSLDPIVALLVAGNIIWAGVHIARESVFGLMDTALPPGEQQILNSILEPYAQGGVAYHALRTRQAGARRFVTLHVLVPGAWSVQRGHHLLEQIEADIRRALPNVTVLTHLESLDDPASWADQELDRPS